MIGFLIKDFVRSKALIGGLVLLLVAGLSSLYIGGLFLSQQEEVRAQAAEAQRSGIDHTLDFVADDDLGLFLYYVRFGVVNELPNLAGLSLGHRDIHPIVKNVNIRNLEEQRHESVLRNPLYQLLGNLDFNFVLVFLFPLVIIALCFNLFSEEKERGTWSLVLSQSEQPERVLRYKLFLRFGAVAAMLLFLLVLAKVYLGIPLAAPLLAFVAVAFLYVTFWFSLSWLVIRLGRSSSANALALIFSWVLLTIVAPGAINALVLKLYPTPEAYEAMLESRDGYHNKWDEPVGPTLTKFQSIYPQFSGFEHPEHENFSWLWYYAMQHLGDEEAKAANVELQQKLERRSHLSRLSGYFLPSVHTQLALNTLSKADLTNYLSFQEALMAFHEKKRLGFYPKIFEEQSVSSLDWGAEHPVSFQDDREVEWLSSLLPLILANVLLLALAKLFGVSITQLKN